MFAIIVEPVLVLTWNAWDDRPADFSFSHRSCRSCSGTGGTGCSAHGIVKAHTYQVTCTACNGSKTYRTTCSHGKTTSHSCCAHNKIIQHDS